MLDRLSIMFLSIIPKKTLSRMVGKLARSNFSRLLIPLYVRHFQIDAGQAEKPLQEYCSLTDFFTRRLKEGLRPISKEPKSIVSPVDGRASSFGKIVQGQLIQAKGINYTVKNLLGGDEVKAEKYINGTYLTIYLSPRDYHRIHAPLAGQIIEYAYIPGTLFPVNVIGVSKVKGLFTKNERLITYLQTEAGEAVVVKVGATIVGSVKVVYNDHAGTNLKGALPATKKIENGPWLNTGDELGRFEFGSTVILLFEPGKIRLNADLKEGDFLMMGQKLGEII